MSRVNENDESLLLCPENIIVIEGWRRQAYLGV